MVKSVPPKIRHIPEFDQPASSPGQASHPLFGAVVVPVPAVKQGKDTPGRQPAVNPLDGAIVISS
jgi:hypothetical protein